MATTLNDAIRDSLGGGSLNDGLLDFFRDGGAGANSPLPDAERQWLIIQLAFPVIVFDTNNDLWMEFLPPPGSINDRQFIFWAANPTLPTASLFPIGEVATAVSPNNATVVLTVDTDGFVKKSINGGPTVNLYDWIVQGVASDFEFMASGLTGDTGNISGSAFNTFLPPPVSWTMANTADAASNKSVNFTLQVRRVSDAGGGNQASVTLQANVTAAPILPNADLQPVSQTATAQSPANASVNVEIDNDGFVKASQNGGAQSNLYQWIQTGVVTDFQFRATNLTGDTGNFSGAAFNVWLAAPIDWSIINSDDTASNKACDFTVEVRRISDFVVLDTTTFHVGANVTPPTPVADLQPINEASSAVSPANSTINVQVATDGFVKKSVNGGALTNLYQWVQVGVAADFQLRGFNLTGDTANLTGSSFGSFLAPPLTWTVTNSDDAAGTKGVDFSLEVRRVSDSVVTDTTSVSLDAAVTAAPPNADLQPVSQTSTAVSPADSSVYLEASTDGFIKRSLNNGTLTSLYSYILTGVGSDFQFRVSNLTGNTANLSGPALDTWLSPPLNWLLTNSDDAPGSKTCDWLVEVRRVSDSVVLDNANFSVTATVTPSGTDIAALLFAAGEQGCWFDASDMATMWQDSAGTTPVTAVEQPVGRWTDKSGRSVVGTQATAAARPIFSARKNHIQASENFADAYWTKTGCTVNGVELVETSANSTHSYSRATILPVIYGPSGYTLTAVFRVRRRDRSNAAILIGNTALSKYYRVIFELNSGTVVGTPENVGAMVNPQYLATNLGSDLWDIRLTVTFPSAEAAGAGAAIYAVNTTSVTYTGTAGLVALEVIRSQLEWGPLATSYQSSTSSTVYDTVGFPRYLRFDGTDDFIQTTVMNLTATNKVTSWVGATKLSDNSQGVIYEFSNSTVANSGVFGFVCPLTSGPNVVWRTRGNNTADANISAGISAPVNIVATGEADIGVPTAKIRANGQTVTSATSQGTGNYGNFAAYFARRGGSTNPYTGGISQLIIRGAVTSAADILTVENFISDKMGVAPAANINDLVYDTNAFGVNSTATLRFKTDGFAEVVGVDPSNPPNGNMYQWMTAGFAPQFQFMASNLQVLQGTANMSGSAFDTWLSPPVAWTLTDSVAGPGSANAVSFDLQVRRTTDNVVLDNAIVELSVNRL